MKRKGGPPTLIPAEGRTPPEKKRRGKEKHGVNKEKVTLGSDLSQKRGKSPQ